MANEIRLFLSALLTQLLQSSNRSQRRLAPYVQNWKPTLWRAIRTAGGAGLMFCAAMSVSAQIRSGTITGRVTDQNGAVVVGATVRVTSTDTHATYATTTGQTGDVHGSLSAGGNLLCFDQQAWFSAGSNPRHCSQHSTDCQRRRRAEGWGSQCDG